MSDKVVGYVCAGGMLALVLSNVWMGRQVTELKSEVQTARIEVSEIKQDVAALQKIVLYRSTEKLTVTSQDVQCLAKNIFHEAGIEDWYGKIAVGQVTLNRLRTGQWGGTICDVVYAKAQFSWTNKKKKREMEPKGKLWRESLAAAREVLYSGKRIKGLEKSGFYHTDYIEQPEWAKGKDVALQIGQHIFYQG